MSTILTFRPGPSLPMPAGTLLVRADLVMTQMPGPGGFSIIIEAAGKAAARIISVGLPDTRTSELAHMLASEIGHVVGANRALLLVRSRHAEKLLIASFAQCKLIRIIGQSPLAVADATRLAHVAATRAALKAQPWRETSDNVLVNDDELDPASAADQQRLRDAICHLVQTDDAGLAATTFREAAQTLIDAATAADAASLERRKQMLVGRDLPRAISGRHTLP